MCLLPINRFWLALFSRQGRLTRKVQFGTGLPPPIRCAHDAGV